MKGDKVRISRKKPHKIYSSYLPIVDELRKEVNVPFLRKRRGVHLNVVLSDELIVDRCNHVEYGAANAEEHPLRNHFATSRMQGL